MDTRFESAQSWFLERLAARVVAVFEAMIGERPEVRCELASAPEAGGFLWRQAFGGTPGAVWIEASEKHWTEAGNQILVAAGIEDADKPTLQSTYVEIVGQVLSGVAQDFSTRLGREVVCSEGGESAVRAGAARWALLSVQFGGKAAGIAEIS